MEKMTFRNATAGDCGLILEFIRGIAAYEKMLDQVVATEEMLQQVLFREHRAEVLFVLEDGVEVGFAPVFSATGGALFFAVCRYRLCDPL